MFTLISFWSLTESFQGQVGFLSTNSCMILNNYYKLHPFQAWNFSAPHAEVTRRVTA